MLTSSVSDSARLKAAAAPHAGAWLEASATNSIGNRLTSAEFKAAVSLRIGQQQLPQDKWCPKCDQPLDKFAIHAVCCASGGDRTVKHNGLRDATHFHLSTAGFDAKKEVPGLLPDDPRRRPGDLLVPDWVDGRAMALDFAVTCPLQASARNDAAKNTLATAMAYESHKLADRETARRCQDQAINLKPMVVETFGGWGPIAQGVFKIVARKASEKSGLPQSVTTNHIYQNLGIKLQRANARSILARLAATPRSKDAAAIAMSHSEAALLTSLADRELG